VCSSDLMKIKKLLSRGVYRNLQGMNQLNIFFLSGDDDFYASNADEAGVVNGRSW